MYVLIRVILACALVFQALPGFGAARCAAMSGGASVCDASGANEPEACACCPETDAPDSCAPGDDSSACCCAEPRREEPTPPGDSKPRQVQELVVVMPAPIGVLPSAPKATMAKWSPRRVASHRSKNPIQSILCVWLT